MVRLAALSRAQPPLRRLARCRQQDGLVAIMVGTCDTASQKRKSQKG